MELKKEKGNFEYGVVITGRTFRITLISYFVINVLTVLGTIIDGLVIGNYMSPIDVAASALVTPVVILHSIISVMVGTAFQVISLRDLAGGDIKHAGRVLGLTLFTGITLSLAFALVIFILSGPISHELGIFSKVINYGPCSEYLRGIAIGMPGITVMNILTRSCQLEGKRRPIVLSVIVMVSVSFIGDAICVWLLHTGLFGISLTTSLGYYAADLVLYLPQLKGEMMLKPEWEGLSIGELVRANSEGIAAGFTVAFCSATFPVRAMLINQSIVDLLADPQAGLHAYNTGAQASYLVDAFLNAMIATMFLLGNTQLFEQDKKGFKNVMDRLNRYEIGTAVLLSVLMYIFAEWIPYVYLGANAGTEVHRDAAGIMEAYALGLPLLMLIMIFASYIQIFGHMIIPNILYLLVNVAIVRPVVILANAYADAHSENMIRLIFFGFCWGELLLVLMLPLFVMIINKRPIRCLEDFRMFPPGFGVPEDDEIQAVITNQDEVMEFSLKTDEFCKKKTNSARTAYYTSLAVEEMGTNVIKHGFTRDQRKRKHALDARVVYKDGDLIVRLRDNSLNFNPLKKAESVFKSEDKSSFLGLKMILGAAEEIRYTNLLDLNNLIIRIKANPDEEKNKKEGS